MQKYYRLYRELKARILSGAYKSGEKLPSKRVLADREGVSVITVERACQMLADEGYIQTKERQGYFVSDARLQPPSHIPAEPIAYLPEPSAPPEDDLAYSAWFRTVRRVLTEKGSLLFVKAPMQGCAVLRNEIAAYLARYRHISAQPRQIVIGSGAEQLYEIVVRIFGRERIYGIEEPSYRQIEGAYTAMGAKICRLPLAADGISSETLHSADFDILHVTPFHSYPTGITTPIGKRMEYLQWAAERNSYIIEDDFDSEFFLPGQPLETLYALDGRRCVVYINTFSKSLSPSMRVGYMILPEPLLNVYAEKLEGMSCSVPVMDQYVLAEFIRSGDFERHLNHMRRKMRREENAGM